MLVHHKWFIRAILAVFWAAEIIAWQANWGFITYIATNYLGVMGTIIFLTFMYFGEPFYSYIFGLTTQGGEPMEKSNKIMGVIVALLFTFAVLMIWDVSRPVILNAFQEGVFNPVYWMGVGFSNWLNTFPGGIVLVSGVGVGLFLAIFLNMLVRPRTRFRQGTSQSTASTGSSLSRSSQTPANATTRPEPPVQKVEISVKAEPTPKPEPVKEETVTT